MLSGQCFRAVARSVRRRALSSLTSGDLRDLGGEGSIRLTRAPAGMPKHVALLEISNPDHRNALSPTMMADFSDAADEVAEAHP